MGELKEGEKKGDTVAAKKDDGTVTVILKLDMHCEGCAKKVQRSVKHFDGVESVKADCANNKLTVIGHVDPIKIKERVEEKTKKRVELVSPPPKDGGGGEEKSHEKFEKKSDDKAVDQKKPKEPPVSTVVLKTRVHCDGCAHKIKKIISKYEGVQDVNVDLQKDVATVTGRMNMKELLPYLNTKLKRSVEIANMDKKDDGGAAEKKPTDGGGQGQEEKGSGEEKKEKGDGSGGEKKEDAKPTTSGGDGVGRSEESAPKIEVNKMEYYGYPYGYGGYSYDPRQGYGNGYVAEYWHEPAPQMFSDENPNACFIM
ncbi:hypothetical protein Nepgr_025033 [Nepenthes gracilis]|uniref:HMA domain-containing protein n=1 Tax=Nepenthes gracilis TaxID=150966 RepID=A0AAD3Y0N7_NEPGR|nr:hypothetical protein Nepgr_025033 [Nepenthes gracilis]